MKKNIAATIIASVLFGFACANAEEVRVLWEKNCASCHGKDGKGQTKMGRQAGVKDYTDSKVQETLDDAKAFKSVKEGIKENGKEKMKPFADKLTDDEIKSLVAYMRTFKK